MTLGELKVFYKIVRGRIFKVQINKRFLKFNEFYILDNCVSISHKDALNKANKEYEVYISDIDKEIRRIKG